ncbi:MAG: sensor histidine kinase [Candidatus Eremiobacteraeota bacterium]|nr:sensor histidine kinase [Candidatus Eremiobacteraeota bacterium]MBC5828440.1 sensor histidine kinase [Candidatus Eremiobacteraeota bacterium]
MSVEDTGYGVREEQRSLLFQRIKVGRTPAHGVRNGLGLYIVRRIAEQHGGTVSYRPRLPHGSVFSIEPPSIPGDNDDA